MYIGDRPEAMPMPMPPKKRAARKPLKVLKAPVRMADRRKINAEEGLATNTVGEPTTGASAYHTAHKGYGHGKPLLRGRVGYAKEQFVKRLRSTDDHPVITEEETTHR